jgi:aspartate aminotransferase-like enzyme/ribosomal protein S18 acetylase RimI-like enzyme
MAGTLRYKIADTAMEFEAIHRLNHRTFAQEIPQHAAAADGRLVDRFHDENTYVVCLDGSEVVGMISGRAQRPFSLDRKLDDLDRYLPAGSKPVEVRLLAVDPAYRNRTIIARLVAMVSAHFAERGCDLAVISGTTRAVAMYQRMGFVPFGPLVGAVGAQFQPMYLTAESASHTTWACGPAGTEPENLLPGPVSIAPEVSAAFARPPVYHRSPEFVEHLTRVHERLAALVRAPYAQVLVGSGTLANDVVAAQLSLLDSSGLILTHGEFGERLVDHATRFRLDFTVHSRPWGEAFGATELAERIGRMSKGDWLWAVHCETSTGTLADLPLLSRLCHAAGVRLAVDCISSIGTVPLDLTQVEYASAASGKALGSLPGLSVVFSRHRAEPAPTAVPRYLDLGYYAHMNGVAFTHSSNLVAALATALEITDWPQRYADLARASTWLRAQLGRLGLAVVAESDQAAPAVITIVLPPELDSALLGKAMRGHGFIVAHESSYLRQRNWIQLALMGRWTWPTLRGLVRALGQCTAGQAG